MVLDASKIDKKKLGFDTEEFFRQAKEQNKDTSERRFSKFDIEKGLFDYDYPDEWFHAAYSPEPGTEEKDRKEARMYRQKMSKFFTNYIFKASLTYDGIIPADAIIDVYGPGWVVASSKKT